jgi:hypothetical protein
MKENDIPAFPRTYGADGHNGMTLRDYFAAQIITAYLTNVGIPSMKADWYAGMAYEMADAMLKEREKIK